MTVSEARIGLGTIAREWGRIGCLGFGGPPAHIALLRELCVARRRWISPAEFEDGVAVTNLLPGPASTQLAILTAWRLRGTPGALVGGVCFIAPGLVAILALAAFFLAGDPPRWASGAAAGAGAAVAAVALHAATRLVPASRRRVTGRAATARWGVYLGVGAVAAMLLGPWLVVVLVAVGLCEVGLVVGAARRAARDATRDGAVPRDSGTPSARPDADTDATGTEDGTDAWQEADRARDAAPDARPAERPSAERRSTADAADGPEGMGAEAAPEKKPRPEETSADPEEMSADPEEPPAQPQPEPAQADDTGPMAERDKDREPDSGDGREGDGACERGGDGAGEREGERARPGRATGGRAHSSAAGPLLLVASAAAGGGGLAALLWVALKVGALSYGGGFVIVPLMRSDAVDTQHWMTHGEFLNAVALGQITPGPVVHTVAAVGYAAAGLFGALLATLVAFGPSFLGVVYGGRHFDRLREHRGVRAFFDGAGPAVIGAIAGSAVPLALDLEFAWQYGMLAAAAVWLLAARRGVVSALVGAGALGVVIALAGGPVG